MPRLHYAGVINTKRYSYDDALLLHLTAQILHWKRTSLATLFGVVNFTQTLAAN